MHCPAATLSETLSRTRLNQSSPTRDEPHATKLDISAQAEWNAKLAQAQVSRALARLS